MRVLVTGSMSLTGQQLCNMLAEKGHPVLGVDNSALFCCYHDRIERDFYGVRHIRGYVDQLNDVCHIMTKFNPDCVVHLEMLLDEEECKTDLAYAVRTNVQTLSTILITSLDLWSADSNFGGRLIVFPSVDGDWFDSISVATLKSATTIAVATSNVTGLRVFNVPFLESEIVNHDFVSETLYEVVCANLAR